MNMPKFTNFFHLLRKTRRVDGTPTSEVTPVGRFLNLTFQSHGQGPTWWSSRPSVQSICVLFILWQSNHFWLRYSKFQTWPWKFKVKVMANVKFDGHIWGLVFNWYACFLFRSNRTYLTLKIQGQGDGENRPKSNQVIYRSGPSVLPKMREIWKVVQKLSHEQDWGHRRRRTYQYKKIKVIPGIPGWLYNTA